MFGDPAVLEAMCWSRNLVVWRRGGKGTGRGCGQARRGFCSVDGGEKEGGGCLILVKFRRKGGKRCYKTRRGSKASVLVAEQGTGSEGERVAADHTAPFRAQDGRPRCRHRGLLHAFQGQQVCLPLPPIHLEDPSACSAFSSTCLHVHRRSPSIASRKASHTTDCKLRWWHCSRDRESATHSRLFQCFMSTGRATRLGPCARLVLLLLSSMRLLLHSLRFKRNAFAVWLIVAFHLCCVLLLVCVDGTPGYFCCTCLCESACVWSLARA